MSLALVDFWIHQLFIRLYNIFQYRTIPYNSPPLCPIPLHFCFLSSSSCTIVWWSPWPPPLCSSLLADTIWGFWTWDFFVCGWGCQPLFSSWSTRISVIGKLPKACLVAGWLSGSLKLASPLIHQNKCLHQGGPKAYYCTSHIVSCFTIHFRNLYLGKAQRYCVGY